MRRPARGSPKRTTASRRRRHRDRAARRGPGTRGVARLCTARAEPVKPCGSGPRSTVTSLRDSRARVARISVRSWRSASRSRGRLPLLGVESPTKRDGLRRAAAQHARTAVGRAPASRARSTGSAPGWARSGRPPAPGPRSRAAAAGRRASPGPARPRSQVPPRPRAARAGRARRGSGSAAPAGDRRRARGSSSPRSSTGCWPTNRASCARRRAAGRRSSASATGTASTTGARRPPAAAPARRRSGWPPMRSSAAMRTTLAPVTPSAAMPG